MKKSSKRIPDGMRQVRYFQIATIQARKLRFEARPAIYVWYRDIDLQDSITSAEGFIASLDSLLQSSLSDKFEGNLGYLYGVSVQESPRALSPKRREQIEMVARNEDARLRLAEILASVVNYQAPLYIGKAMDLRKRIGEHVDGASGLSKRFMHAGIEIEKCMIRYQYFDENSVDPIVDAAGVSQDDIVLLIEDVLTRLAPAAFVRRPG